MPKRFLKCSSVCTKKPNTPELELVWPFAKKLLKTITVTSLPQQNWELERNSLFIYLLKSKLFFFSPSTLNVFFDDVLTHFNLKSNSCTTQCHNCVIGKAA